MLLCKTLLFNVVRMAFEDNLERNPFYRLLRCQRFKLLFPNLKVLLNQIFSVRFVILYSDHHGNIVIYTEKHYHNIKTPQFCSGNKHKEILNSFCIIFLLMVVLTQYQRYFSLCFISLWCFYKT